MATTEPTTTTPDDQGCTILIVPFGATKSRRLILPHDVAQWLYCELGAVLADPPVKPGEKAEAKASRPRTTKARS